MACILKPSTLKHGLHKLWKPSIHKLAISTMEKKIVRIGCSSGFWGDTQTSTEQLVEKGNLNYLVSDYLSEITMSLLTAAKIKDPTKGYAPDFVSFSIGPQIKKIKEQQLRVVSNAGGTNPKACAYALQKAASKAGTSFDIAVITGDDIMHHHQTLYKSNSIKNNGKGMLLPKSVMSMNAYLGANPIKKALDLGAEVVITGRCVDSALVLGPLMHEFDWKEDDFDRLACGSVAGHLLECGAQSTGGIFTDWQHVPDWDNIGFPIAECYSDGTFVVTKPPATGGLVTPATVAEQLVYEIGNPTYYMLPDVTCDLTGVTITQHGEDAVLVQGVTGLPPPFTYKVCATFLDGYRSTAVFSVVGRQAIEKGRRTAESILKRVRRIFFNRGLEDFKRVHIQAVGDEYLYGENARTYGDDGPRETVMWMAVEHEKKEALQLLSMEIAAAGTGMAPGLCGLVGGRPKVSPVLKLFSFAHHKSNVPAYIQYGKEETQLLENIDYKFADKTFSHPVYPQTEKGSYTFTLRDLAYARSGDKGDDSNIGVIARHPAFMPYLYDQLTAKAVHKHFMHLFSDDAPVEPVTRFLLPGINAFNFLLKNSLGGGGVASMRLDPQGKSYAQILLEFEIRNVPDLRKLVI